MLKLKRASTLLGMAAFAASILLTPISIANSAVKVKPNVQWGEPGDIGNINVGGGVYIAETSICNLDNYEEAVPEFEQNHIVPCKAGLRFYLSLLLKCFLWRM